MMLRYLPNLLTILRCILIIPFVVCFLSRNYATAFYIFLCAGLTDGLDGWCARQFHWESYIGLILDPIADKILIVISFVLLAWVDVMPWWLIELVLFRDMSILLGVVAWYHVMQRQLVFKPSRLSKTNTLIEFVLISSILWQLSWGGVPKMLHWSLIALVAVTTTGSYVEYMWLWAKRAALQSKIK